MSVYSFLKGFLFYKNPFRICFCRIFKEFLLYNLSGLNVASFLIYLTGSKVRFFFPRNSLFFRTFRKKSSECVKKPFFFSRAWKKKTPSQLSEWVALSSFWGEKKNVQKFQKSAVFFFRFAGKKKHFFQIRVSEWPLNYSAEKKKPYLWTRASLARAAFKRDFLYNQKGNLLEIVKWKVKSEKVNPFLVL